MTKIIYTKSFRAWLQEMWMLHKDEMAELRQPVNYGMADYFARYRWWLKREYQHQTRTTQS